MPYCGSCIQNISNQFLRFEISLTNCLKFFGIEKTLEECWKLNAWCFVFFVTAQPFLFICPMGVLECRMGITSSTFMGRVWKQLNTFILLWILFSEIFPVSFFSIEVCNLTFFCPSFQLSNTINRRLQAISTFRALLLCKFKDDTMKWHWRWLVKAAQF